MVTFVPARTEGGDGGGGGGGGGEENLDKQPFPAFDAGYDVYMSPLYKNERERGRGGVALMYVMLCYPSGRGSVPSRSSFFPFSG